MTGADIRNSNESVGKSIKETVDAEIAKLQSRTAGTNSASLAMPGRATLPVSPALSTGGTSKFAQRRLSPTSTKMTQAQLAYSGVNPAAEPQSQAALSPSRYHHRRDTSTSTPQHAALNNTEASLLPGSTPQIDMPAVRKSHEEMLQRLREAKDVGDKSTLSVHETSLSRHTPRVHLSPAPGPGTPRATASPHVSTHQLQMMQAPAAQQMHIQMSLGLNTQRVLNTSATLSERSISHMSAGGGSNSGALALTPRIQEPGGGGSAQQRIPAARSALMSTARSQALAQAVNGASTHTAQRERGHIGAFPSAVMAGGGGVTVTVGPSNFYAPVPAPGKAKQAMTFEEKLLQLQQAGAIGPAAGPVRSSLYTPRMRRG